MLNIKKYLPVSTRKTLENTHRKKIQLIGEKRQLLYGPNPMSEYPGSSFLDKRLLAYDEEIKQAEEEIKLWSGKFDPSRNKPLWRIVVPILVYVVGVIFVSIVIKYLYG